MRGWAAGAGGARAAARGGDTLLRGLRVVQGHNLAGRRDGRTRRAFFLRGTLAHFAPRAVAAHCASGPAASCWRAAAAVHGPVVRGPVVLRLGPVSIAPNTRGYRLSVRPTVLQSTPTLKKHPCSSRAGILFQEEVLYYKSSRYARRVGGGREEQVGGAKSRDGGARAAAMREE